MQAHPDGCIRLQNGLRPEIASGQQVISEIAEYVATELSSHFSQMLKPVIDAEFGVNSAGGPLSAHDTPRAAGICNQLLEHPAVTSEITPHIKMALTYVTSRSSSP